MAVAQPQANPGGRRSGSLRRTIGLWEATLSGVGVILGAGVYALIGPAALLAGSAIWLAFLIASICAGVTVYAYARLAPLKPRNSAEFHYTALGFGPRIGFVSGALMLAADLLAAAAVALGFGGYLSHVTGLPVIAGASLLLAGITIILATGVRTSVGIAILLGLVEVIGLGAVIVIGVPALGSVSYLELPQGATGLWVAASLILFAYLGFDELGNLAEEMRDPARDLPRALFLSLLIATTIYLLVALAAVSVVSWQTLGASPAPLALVAERAFGSSADLALSLIALGATANTVLVLLLSGSRSLYGLAKADMLPSAIGRLSARGVPFRAVTAAVAITLAGIVVGRIAEVAALTNAAVLGSFILVDASLLRLALAPGATGLRPTLWDRLLPVGAIGLSAWLLWNAGPWGIALAAAVALGSWSYTGRRPASVPR